LAKPVSPTLSALVGPARLGCHDEDRVLGVLDHVTGHELAALRSAAASDCGLPRTPGSGW
jgi:hypothetical protein